MKFLTPLNPIQQPLIWWDKQKRKIKHHIITLSKIQRKKTQTQQNILKTKLQVAQTQGLHTQIHLINPFMPKVRIIACTMEKLIKWLH